MIATILTTAALVAVAAPHSSGHSVASADTARDAWVLAPRPRRSPLRPCKGRKGRAWRPPSASQLEARCEARDGDSCARLGDLARIGIGGVRRDRDRALRLFDKACRLRSARGCASHAAALSNPHDRNNWFPSRAVKLRRKACDYGHAQSCARLGWYYRTGKLVPQRATEASALFAKGCALGHGPSCFGLAQLLARGAPGVTRDGRKAIRLFHQACASAGEDASGDACSVLGSIFSRRVRGSPISASQVVRLLRKQCAARGKRGCAGLAMLYLAGGAGLRKDKGKAVGLARKACDAYQPGGCLYLALFHSNAIGVPRDFRKAARILLRGCRMGNLGLDGRWGSARSCTRLGVHFSSGAGVKKDYRKAARAFQRACRRGDADGCGQIGLLMATGRGGYAKEPSAGVRRAQIACSFGSGSSCLIVAKAFRKGLPGVPKNPKRSEEYRRFGCKSGYPPACKRL